MLCVLQIYKTKPFAVTRWRSAVLSLMCSLYASTVFIISPITVSGPTPPGTGVMALTTFDAPSNSTSPTNLVFPSASETGKVQEGQTEREEDRCWGTNHQWDLLTWLIHSLTHSHSHSVTHSLSLTNNFIYPHIHHDCSRFHHRSTNEAWFASTHNQNVGQFWEHG